MFELLKSFCELPGPVGDGIAVRNILMKRWRPRVQNLELTRVGNLG
jgi:putative aminopeptidase FrvX